MILVVLEVCESGAVIQRKLIRHFLLPQDIVDTVGAIVVSETYGKLTQTILHPTHRFLTG